MAEILRYVDPNSTAGGDGTTNALAGAARAYASLSAWEAAQQQDLTDGGGDTARVICSSDDAGSTHAADATYCEINGWTTSTTCYITVEAASSHGGKWNNNIYRMAAPGAGSTIAAIESHTRFIGIQFSAVGNAASNVAATDWSTNVAADFYHLYDKCIFTASGQGNNGGFGIYFYKWAAGGTQKAVIVNSLFYGFKRTAAGTNGNGIIFNPLTNNSGKLYIYNCTFADCDTAINLNDDYMAGATYITNSGEVGCTTFIYRPNGATYTETTNSTTDPAFIDAANKDYHLASGDTVWKNAGTDLSADAAYAFSIDIDGQTRPTGAGTWDIGADEYVATGHPAIARWGGVPYMTLGRRKW